MAHGKNPGYRPLDHWFTCDVCGFDFRAHQGKKRWDGFWVCNRDWETRQPQDFVRGRKDKITPDQPLRPVPLEAEVAKFCTVSGQSGVSGTGIAGCMVSGNPLNPDNGIPSGTFGDYLDGTIVGDDYSEDEVLE
jgi:hypothetical protein